MKNLLKIILSIFFIFLLLFIGYFFFGETKPAKEITWGVNFSQKHTQLLGLDWRKVYLAILDDLKVKNIKLITHWDLIEPERDNYYFEDLDWQIQEAEKREAKIILVIGIKTGRWPECHMPQWAQCQILNTECQSFLLEYLEKIVNRYKNSPAIWSWQIENEPLFPFGECPEIEKEFLKKEIDLVKSLDPTRPVIFTDSGEFSFWIRAAQLGDIVGITLHRKVWFQEIKNYISYPFPPVYYWRKSQIIKKIFGKKVICVELQAEPWGPKLLYDSPIEEQEKTMNLARFKKNIDFARNTGLDTFYLWGAEWWYWLREKEKNHEIWEEAKTLFVEKEKTDIIQYKDKAN